MLYHSIFLYFSYSFCKRNLSASVFSSKGHCPKAFKLNQDLALADCSRVSPSSLALITTFTYCGYSPGADEILYPHSITKKTFGNLFNMAKHNQVQTRALRVPRSLALQSFSAATLLSAALCGGSWWTEEGAHNRSYLITYSASETFAHKTFFSMLRTSISHTFGIFT